MCNWRTYTLMTVVVFVRNMSVFGSVKVLLNLFHACHRITSAANKRSALYAQFCKEFGLIFRQETTKEIPDWKTPLTESKSKKTWMYVSIDGPTLKKDQWRRWHCVLKQTWELTLERGPYQILRLVVEQNEYVHQILNRSLLVGSTSISIELATAILTILFFPMNTKKKTKMFLEMLIFN